MSTESHFRLILTFITFALSFAAYLVTMSRTVVVEDDGIFILSCYHLGVSHPPGYPLYTLLGKLFTLLPFGSMAFRVHCLSAFLGALACAVLFWILLDLEVRPTAAFVGALGLAFSEVFWSQCIIAEVYSLNALLFFLMLLVTLRIAKKPAMETVDLSWLNAQSHWFLLALLFGLGLSNHWPLVLLSSPCLVLILLPQWRKFVLHLPSLVFGLFLGLLPYAWMVIRSRMCPLTSFYGPLRSFHDLLFVVRRQGYQLLEANPTANWGDKVAFASFYLGDTVNQFTAVGIFLACVGCWRLLHRGQIRVLGGILGGILGTIVPIIVCLGFDYDAESRGVVQVYPLAAYGLLALTVGLGFDEIVGALFQRLGSTRGSRASAVFLGVTFIAGNFSIHFNTNNRAAETWARDYARTVLESLDPNAVLFVESDIPTAAIGYVHQIDGVRPDVAVFHSKGLVYANRLFEPLRLSDAAIDGFVGDFVSRCRRPVFTTDETPRGLPRVESVLFSRVVIKGTQDRLVLSPKIAEFIERTARIGPLVNPMIQAYRRVMLSRLGSSLTAGLRFGGVRGIERPESLLSLVDLDLTGRLSRVSVLLISPTQSTVQAALGELKLAVSQLGPDISKRTRALYYQLLGIASGYLNSEDDARRNLEESVRIWPDQRNTAIGLLMKLYGHSNDQQGLRRLQAQFRVPTGRDG